MKLSSQSFEPNGLIPQKYTGDGENISPPLSWEDIPPGTQSFCLVVEDKDAPVHNWRHWIICDIPNTVHNIPENKIPENCKLIRNSFGTTQYGGPCPVRGTHHYSFKIFALGVPKLERVNEVTFREKIEQHTLDQAELMGIYHRR